MTAFFLTIEANRPSPSLCCFRDGIDDVALPRSLDRNDIEPVLAFNSKCTDSIFNPAIVKINLTMLKKCTQVCLPVFGLGNSIILLSCRAGNRIQPCPV